MQKAAKFMLPGKIGNTNSFYQYVPSLVQLFNWNTGTFRRMSSEAAELFENI